jgi:uncharacterized membrane-anchored protein
MFPALNISEPSGLHFSAVALVISLYSTTYTMTRRNFTDIIITVYTSTLTGIKMYKQARYTKSYYTHDLQLTKYYKNMT